MNSLKVKNLFNPKSSQKAVKSVRSLFGVFLPRGSMLDEASQEAEHSATKLQQSRTALRNVLTYFNH